MRPFKFIIMLLFTVGVTYLLNNGISPLPPLGKFLSPFTGFWQNAEKTDLSYPADLQIEGLSDAVQVLYDDRLVPHIFAQNTRDAILTQGYITAQHRLWQMEFQTHAVAGRLSELVGERVLKRDMENRRQGMVWGAERNLEEWKKTPEHYTLIEAYAEGINAYINSLSPADYPLEYKLMNYAPEEWTPLKSALMLMEMSNTLATAENDVENTTTKQWLGEEAFNFLFPEQNPKQSPIIPATKKWDFIPKALPQTNLAEPIDGKLSHNFPKTPEGIGSNNWAVAAEKTLNGKPILCNDPHLPLSVPSIWYELQMNTPKLNVYGVSLPGSPGIIIGFNENIAWGLTNVGQDVADWYTMDWRDDSRSEYKYDGKYLKPLKRVETYKIKGGKTVQDTVYYTHFGPIAHLDANPKKDLAYRWVAHDPSDAISPFLKLNQAENYDDYSAAISEHSCPAQNFAFASQEDIALWVQGKFPLKRKEQGRFLQKADGRASQWAGFIPQEHNPHIKNPERGFVSSANQHSTAPDYPYYYTGGFGDYRGRRINQVLEANNQITVKDMMALQNDNYSLHAAEALPLLLQQVDKSALSKEELKVLKKVESWDYVYDKDKAAPGIFKIWYDNFYQQTWDEFYSKDREAGVQLNYPENWKTIELLETAPEHIYFDQVATSAKETAAEVVNKAFQMTCKEISTWENKEDKAIRWGDYLNTTIRHLARIPAFTLDNIDNSGDRYAPNANSSWGGPSWRMVVELGEEMNAYGVYPGGQSGNPGSKYFDNFTSHWATGEYYPLLFMKEAEETNERIIITQKISK